MTRWTLHALGILILVAVGVMNVVGPQAYQDTLPSSLGTKGTGAPGRSELCTVMAAIVNVFAKAKRGRVEKKGGLNEGKISRGTIAERISEGVEAVG